MRRRTIDSSDMAVARIFLSGRQWLIGMIFFTQQNLLYLRTYPNYIFQP